MDYEEDEDLEALENIEIDEFALLEKYFHASKSKVSDVRQANVWIEIALEFRWKTNELFQVIMLLLCIPNGTSELERIFSVIKAIKSKKRSRLSAKKLAKMINIYYFFDLESYDKEALYEIFKALLEKE